MYGLDFLFLTCTQVTKMSAVFNNVFKRIFRMCRRTSVKIIYNSSDLKTLDCMNEERLMCVNRNCGASTVELIRLFQTLCTPGS